MRDLGRFLVIAGISVLFLGLIFSVAGSFGLGRLPGDFVYRRGNVVVYFPLMTSILLSIVLTIVMWLFRR